jgi:hypothetical protein
MVDLEVLIGSGAVVTAAFVLWRERALCRKRFDQRAREEAAARQVRVSAVDVPPLGNFPTAEDALDAVMKPKATPKKTTKKRAPRKAAKKTT